MDKVGRGDDIPAGESLLIWRMIANRTWPEAPEITVRHQAIQQWMLLQPENARLFTDPDGWSRGLVADAVYERLVAAGLTDQDTPHTPASERFRVFWTGLTREQKAELPVGEWMYHYYVRLGYDMRSDAQRSRDEAFDREQQALRDAGLRDQAEAERQRKEAAEADERERQKWFDDNWAEEDRRIAREQAERDLIWDEFIAFFTKLSPEERARALQEMTAEQREELDRRLPPQAAAIAPSPPARIGSDAAAAQVRLPVAHHSKPPETGPSVVRTGGAITVAEAAAAEADRIAAMRSFRVVTPSIWAGASDTHGFHVKRESAKGGALHQMCPYPAGVYGEASGKVAPSFAPGTIEEIRAKLDSEAVEHRKWGREPEIRPFAIGPFKGYLLETRMRFARGGWSHSGYRDSATEAIGHGWVTLNGRTFEVSYGVGSGGCWDNSQRPFQESQTLAALREAQAILAGLRLVAEPGVTQIPYTGRKLDGSDLPVVRLEPSELGRLNPGETAIVRARVENLSPDDRPLRFEWTGEHEGDGGEVLIRATQPGTFSLAVTVEGAQYALGSASLSYEVSALQVRAERLEPFATGPVPAGAEVRLRAFLTAEGRPATGDFVYRWQPDPEVVFEEQDEPTGVVTARFSEPGRYLVWVQVLRRQGEVLSTVIQSEQLEIVVDSQSGSSGDTVVSEGRPFTGSGPAPAESCWHSLNPDPRGWTAMPMAPLHPTTSVAPGSYIVLVGPSGIGGQQIPSTWRSFGPFEIEAGHTYGATIKDTGDRLTWERDPLILEFLVTAARSDPSAYIYVRNDAFLVDHWHAICVLPAPVVADQGALAGLWTINANGYPGQIEFVETGGSWSARLNLHNAWEPLERVSFDPATGGIEFFRPNADQNYRGALAEKTLKGTFDQSGAGRYLWEATSAAPVTQSPDRPPADNQTAPPVGVDGTLRGVWKINANGYPGQIEFEETGGSWTARLNLHNAWEPLERVSFDRATGGIEFFRPSAVELYRQQYRGTLTHKGINGTFDQGGSGSYLWEARR
jgi:hypothetical protein